MLTQVHGSIDVMAMTICYTTTKTQKNVLHVYQCNRQRDRQTDRQRAMNERRTWTVLACRVAASWSEETADGWSTQTQAPSQCRREQATRQALVVNVKHSCSQDLACMTCIDWHRSPSALLALPAVSLLNALLNWNIRHVYRAELSIGWVRLGWVGSRIFSFWWVGLGPP